MEVTMQLTDEKVSQAIAAVMGIDVDLGWWCEKCQSFVDGRQVTHQENHDNCGYPVIYLQFSAFTPDGIFAWKSYMEKEMSEEWNDYIFSYMTEPIVKVVDGTLPISSVKPNRIRLNDMLNPLNLVRYLFDKGKFKEIVEGEGE
jgi:hypothetical protein